MVSVVRQDITKLEIEAIVNASNESGLGCHIPQHCIDNAIHTAAGPELLLACEKLGGIPVGVAKITPAFNLPCKYVIHVTGPRAKITECKEESPQFDFDALAKSYFACLDLAALHKIQELAFCCLSTGIFGFPKSQSAQVAVESVKKWLFANKAKLKIVFCVFTYEDMALYQALLDEVI
jgi:O-acetyl-ADP-ribose deacetylase (regulator of RNase III)